MQSKTKKRPPAADRHTSTHMVRLSADLHALLMRAAEKNNRPATWELRIALLKHCEELGIVADVSTES
jgi:hypothetical protein